MSMQHTCVSVHASYNRGSGGLDLLRLQSETKFPATILTTHR